MINLRVCIFLFLSLLSITNRAQDKSLMLTLKLRDGKNATLSGNILEGTDIPLSGVRISVYNKETDILLQQKTSGADGNVTIKLELFKAYLITASKNGYVSEKLSLIANAKGKENKKVLHIDGGIYYIVLYSPESDKLSAELLDKPFTRIIYYEPDNKFGVDPYSFNVDFAYEKNIKKEVGKLNAQARVDAYSRIRKANGGSAEDYTKHSKMIAGILESKSGGVQQPISNVRILLSCKAENGDTVLEDCMTTAYGAFVLRNPIQRGQRITLSLPDSNFNLANIPVCITNLMGNEVVTVTCSTPGKFAFEFLKQDTLNYMKLEIEENLLKKSLKELAENSKQPATKKTKNIAGILLSVINNQTQPIANTKIQLVASTGNAIEDVFTNGFGSFVFSKTPVGQDFSIAILEKNTKLANTRVLITDLAGKEISSTTSTAEGKFNFVFLKQDELKLITMEVEESSLKLDLNGKLAINDPWLKFVDRSSPILSTTVIPEKVYFAVQDYAITKEGQIILDKVIQVLKANLKIKVEIDSHTDSQGTNEFNMDLSNKRAKSAVDYIVSHGVAKERVSGIGFGETQLLNRCTACTEEQHAQNRRIEFKIAPFN